MSDGTAIAYKRMCFLDFDVVHFGMRRVQLRDGVNRQRPHERDQQIAFGQLSGIFPSHRRQDRMVGSCSIHPRPRLSEQICVPDFHEFGRMFFPCMRDLFHAKHLGVQIVRQHVDRTAFCPEFVDVSYKHRSIVCGNQLLIRKTFIGYHTSYP